MRLAEDEKIPDFWSLWMCNAMTKADRPVGIAKESGSFFICYCCSWYRWAVYGVPRVLGQVLGCISSLEQSLSLVDMFSARESLVLCTDYSMVGRSMSLPLKKI